jgi:hypothetical protein
MKKILFIISGVIASLFLTSVTASAVEDLSAPDVQITSPIDSEVSGVVDIRGSVIDENLSSYSLIIRNDNGDIENISLINVPQETSFVDQSLLSWNTKLYPDGLYAITLSATDDFGNVDQGSTVEKIFEVNNNVDTVIDCRNGGWMTSTDLLFTNQGDCISFFRANINANK